MIPSQHETPLNDEKKIDFFLMFFLMFFSLFLPSPLSFILHKMHLKKTFSKKNNIFCNFQPHGDCLCQMSQQGFNKDKGAHWSMRWGGFKTLKCFTKDRNIAISPFNEKKYIENTRDNACSCGVPLKLEGPVTFASTYARSAWHSPLTSCLCAGGGCVAESLRSVLVQTPRRWHVPVYSLPASSP